VLTLAETECEACMDPDNYFQNKRLT